MAKFAVLNQNSDFRRLYGRGRSKAHPALVSYVAKNRVGFCRIGITTSKKIGNAVVRNRARRVIRAAYAEVAPALQGNYDIVFVARSRTARCKSGDVAQVMQGQLKALGVIA